MKKFGSMLEVIMGFNEIKWLAVYLICRGAAW